MRKPARPTWLLLIVCLLTPLLVGFLGSIVTRPGIEGWYQFLNKPPLNPPAWIFAPVWTALYLMMGWASYLVARHGLSNPRVRPAMTFYVLQLILNAAWSPVFFGLRAPWPALAIIVGMVVSISITTLLFRPISRRAALLMLPYLGWVCFATYLNSGIAWLNR